MSINLPEQFDQVQPMPTITLINGSLGGRDGNTYAVMERLLAGLRLRSRLVEVHLATSPVTSSEIGTLLQQSDGFVFSTGTYWDSWGSPLQLFLEQATAFEGQAVWLGKPAAVVVTMQAVGGKGVLSRLQGILSTLGLMIPPMTGMVYARAVHIASQYAPPTEAAFLLDCWPIEAFDAIGHNLLEAATGGTQWRAWPMDTRNPQQRWFY